MVTVYSAPNKVDVREMNLDALAPSKHNPRRNFDEAELAELAESIRELGVIEPIVVRLVGERGPHEILAGERRWRASKLAGRETIPVRILDVDDATALRVQLVENLQRAELDPIEEAIGYQQLTEICGMSQSQIARSVNRAQPTIANRLRLLKLPKEVLEAISEGKLTPAHGVALARYAAFPKVASFLASVAIARKLNSHQCERVLDDYGYPIFEKSLARYLHMAKFDAAVACANCPFDAHRGNICLNPKHFDELDKSAMAARRAQTESLLAQAKARGDNVLDESSLDRNTYTQISWEKVENCTEECPCRRMVVNRSGATFAVCVDLGRREELKKAEKAAKQREKDIRRAKVGLLLRKRMDRHIKFGAREMALFVEILGYRLGKVGAQRKIAKLHGMEMPDAKSSEPKAIAARLDQLARIDPITLGRFLLEAVLTTQLDEYFGSNYYGGDHLFAWYLGEEKAEAADA